jgi:hypothetical protein
VSSLFAGPCGNLWEWEAAGPSGRLQRYQTDDPSGVRTEADMRKLIGARFPNVEVKNLRPASVYRPPAGVVSYKTYTNGIVDEVIAELARQKMKARVVFAAGRSLLSDPPAVAASRVTAGRSLLKKG